MGRTGHLSNMRGQGRGPRPRSNGSDRGPLRKIVGSEYLPGGRTWETLECGHQQLARRDLMGETNAVRRRCPKCKKGLPPDVKPAVSE